MGSTNEVAAILETSDALGYIESVGPEIVDELDRVARTLNRLARPRGRGETEPRLAAARCGSPPRQVHERAGDVVQPAVHPGRDPSTYPSARPISTRALTSRTTPGSIVRTAPAWTITSPFAV
jgi:hypothetical protein